MTTKEIRPVECINYDSIDPTERHPRYYIIQYIESEYAVYREYPSYCIDDALDTFADWSREALPGLTPDPEYIADMQADARKDGREDEDFYVNDFYLRAGNDSEWLETPLAILEVTLAQLDEASIIIVAPKGREA